MKFLDLNSLYVIFIAKSFLSSIFFANEAKRDDRIQTALVFSNSSNYPFYFSYIDAGLKLSLHRSIDLKILSMSSISRFRNRIGKTLERIIKIIWKFGSKVKFFFSFIIAPTFELFILATKPRCLRVSELCYYQNSERVETFTFKLFISPMAFCGLPGKPKNELGTFQVPHYLFHPRTHPRDSSYSVKRYRHQGH